MCISSEDTELEEAPTLTGFYHMIKHILYQLPLAISIMYPLPLAIYFILLVPTFSCLFLSLTAQ